MQPHQLRVVDEHDLLEHKVDMLSKFFSNLIFATLPNDEQVRLTLQFTFIKLYLEVLNQRIESF